MNIDIFEVIDAAKTKPHGHMPFYPGWFRWSPYTYRPFLFELKAKEYSTNTRFIEPARK